MRVKFTRDYQVKAADGAAYKEGQVVDLSKESAQHFINRGVAEEVSAEKKAGGTQPVSTTSHGQVPSHAGAPEKPPEKK